MPKHSKLLPFAKMVEFISLYLHLTQGPTFFKIGVVRLVTSLTSWCKRFPITFAFDAFTRRQLLHPSPFINLNRTCLTVGMTCRSEAATQQLVCRSRHHIFACCPFFFWFSWIQFPGLRGLFEAVLWSQLSWWSPTPPHPFQEAIIQLFQFKIAATALQH